MSSFLEISQLNKTYPTPKGPAVIVENFDLGCRRVDFAGFIQKWRADYRVVTPHIVESLLTEIRNLFLDEEHG